MAQGRSRKVNPNAATVDAGGGKRVTVGSIKQKLGLASTALIMGYTKDKEGVDKLKADVDSGKVTLEMVARAIEQHNAKKHPDRAPTRPQGVTRRGGETVADTAAMKRERLASYANHFDPQSMTPNDFSNLEQLVNAEVHLHLITEQLDAIYHIPQMMLDQADNIMALEKLAGDLTDRCIGLQKALQIDAKTLDSRKANSTGIDQFQAFVKEGARWYEQYANVPVHCGIELGDFISFHGHPQNSAILWCPRCESMVTFGLVPVGISYDPSQKDEDGKPKVVWLEQAKYQEAS